MKVIYSSCIPDPWLDIAKKLYSENNIEPVYWIGWDDYDLTIDIQKEIKNNFSSCIFHNVKDAWKGKFPEETNKLARRAIDAEMIEEVAKYELIAIKMMDRLDLTQKNFSFEERQRHFKRLLGMWLSVIDEYEVELLISPSIPHRIFDYVLYIACRLKGVKTLMYKPTPLRDIIVPFSDIDHMPIKIAEDYIKFKQNKIDIDLPKEVLEYLKKLTKDYKEAEPDYMVSQRKTNENSILYSVVKKSLKKNNLFHVNKLFKATGHYYKVPGKTIENSNLKGYQQLYYYYKGIRYKKKLKKYYESLCTKDLDLNKEKYVFVGLHYQPEETTSPSAGHYVDQLLIVENISSQVPPGFLVLVKEHASQFYSKMEGQTSRLRLFYDDLLKLPNVRLISSDEPSFKYIDNSVAVATATGTLGTETLVRNKSVLIFGNSWYEYCDNVYRIKSIKDVSSAIEKILGKNNRPADYINYVKAVYKNSVSAYHYKEFDEKSKVKKQDAVQNLAASILKFIDQK